VNILKLVGQTIVQMAKAVWALPKTISNAVKQRQQRATMNELNAERLDRIRNPSKYRGK
jgi:hypothetical protein